MMLYVSMEQELAVKDLFIDRGWGFKKPGETLKFVNYMYVLLGPVVQN